MIGEWVTQSVSPSLKRWRSDYRRFRQFYILDPRSWLDLIATMLKARRALREDRLKPLPAAKETILDLSLRYQEEWRFEKARQLMLTKQEYKWGVCLAMLNYVFHKYVPEGTILMHRFLNDDNTGVNGVNVRRDKEKRLTFDGSYLGLVGLEWYLKHLPPAVLFANSTLEENLNALGKARKIGGKNTMLAEEMMHQYCQRYGWQQGGVSYRIYPEPSTEGS